MFGALRLPRTIHRCFGRYQVDDIQRSWSVFDLHGLLLHVLTPNLTCSFLLCRRFEPSFSRHTPRVLTHALPHWFLGVLGSLGLGGSNLTAVSSG